MSNPFVKSKNINLFGVDVEVREVGVDFLLLSDESKTDTKLLLEMHTSLTKEEVSKLNIEAFNELIGIFFELNNEHFEAKGTHTESKEQGK